MIKRSPIATRLTILIVTFSTAIAVLTTAAQLLFDYRRDLVDLHSRLDEIKNTQIEPLSRLIWSFDNQGIQVFIENILKIPDIEYLRVYVDDRHFWSAGQRSSRNTIDMEIPISYRNSSREEEIAKLQLVASLDTVYARLMKRAVVIFIGNGLKTFFVSLFILFLFQRLVTRHLVDLAEHATRVAAGKGDGPFRLQRKKGSDEESDELDNVTSAINHMRENLDTKVEKIAAAKATQESLQEQLLQAQKMESVGRLAGGVAHDFNNMLGVILGHTELALEQIGPNKQLYANLEEIQRAAERSANLTRQLLAYARRQTVTPRVVNINETVQGMLEMLRRLIGEDIDLSWLPGANLCSIYIDPSQIDQILANLCVNARDAISGTGTITIETDNATLDKAYNATHSGVIPGDYVLLAVSDDGCGLDVETQNHLFEPFFTTKEIGKGTGLGLATVYGIVKQNNGVINVYSEPGHGTTFKIYLPCNATKVASQSEQKQTSTQASGSETILLVEDEPAILKITTQMLETIGYTVIAAGTPGEAIHLAREHKGQIDLLITDVVMPEMNGRELARNLLTIYPDIKRLFMSGYTANVIAHHGVLDDGVHFIQKPFSKNNLAAKTEEALKA